MVRSSLFADAEFCRLTVLPSILAIGDYYFVKARNDLISMGLAKCT